MANEEYSESRILVAGRQLVVWAINALGFIGILLIIYPLAASEYTPWAPVEALVDHLSVGATLIGVLLTAISVYVPENQRRSDQFSKLISAPLVVFACMIALAMHFMYSFAIPPHTLNGIAILGIAGGLFRTISR